MSNEFDNPIQRHRCLRLALECGESTVAACSELHVRGMPIDGAQLIEHGATASLARLAAAGLQPCQVNFFEYNPLHPDSDIREAAERRLRTLIPLAAGCRCPWIAFGGGSLHPDTFGGSDPKNLSSDTLEAAAARLRPMAAFAASHGVRLTLEPHIRGVLATPERCAALVALVGSDALRITMDVTNFYEALDCLDSERIIERCAVALARVTGMVHLKEVALTDGFHLHAGLVPIGAGRTDWSRVLDVAAWCAGPEGWVMVEHCAGLAEARATIAHVRRAAQRAGIDLV